MIYLDMFTLFTSTELQSIEIQKKSPPTRSEAYQLKRDQLWALKEQEATQKNKSLWNGIIYTVEDLVQTDENKIRLELSTCEYKDILFKIYNPTETQTLAPRIHYLTVCSIPMTLDNRFVFGLRGSTTAIMSNSIGLIGGSVNEDEREIQTFSDFEESMKLEIEEETLIPTQDLKLQLFSLNFFRMKYEFLYTFRLPVHSDEIQKFHRDGEFSQLIALNSEEVCQSTLNQTDSYRYCKNYLPLLAQSLLKSVDSNS